MIERSDGPISPISWRQLCGLVARTATILTDALDSDAASARRIGHVGENTLADVLLALASMSLGAIEVPFDHRLTESEIRRRWNRIGGLWLDRDFRARLVNELFVNELLVNELLVNELLVNELLVTEGDAASSSRLPSDPVDVDSASLILWTSGTTGDSRGVTLSHRNLAGNAAAKLAAVPQSPNDIRLCVLPLSHAYARTCDFGTWLLSGCTLAVAQGYAGLCRLAPAIRPTLINVVPSLAYRLLEEATLPGLDRLRLLGCGGAAISESAFHRWRDRGVTVIQGYGLTEASPVICSATPDNALPGLVGELVDGWDSEVRDGQLFVRGPHTMLGYWDDELATGKRIDRSGWLGTGDLVQRDASSGQLRILGRIDDVIVLDNGTKISPSTVEREVEQIAGVAHAFLLLQQASLQLWFDARPNACESTMRTAIRQRLDQFPEARRCSIHRFTPPLSEPTGELTVKGTIRRTRILQNRFPHQAGS